MHASYNYDEYKLTWQDRINDENQEATQECHPSRRLVITLPVFAYPNMESYKQLGG